MSSTPSAERDAFSAAFFTKSLVAYATAFFLLLACMPAVERAARAARRCWQQMRQSE